jgi:hypothetical protein
VLTIDGQRLDSLSTDDLQYFEARFFLVPGTGTVYVNATLSVIREQAVGDGFCEQLTILNHADEPADLKVRMDAGCAFADLRRATAAAARLAVAQRAETEISAELARAARRLPALRERWIPRHEEALALLGVALDQSQVEQAIRVRWLTRRGGLGVP